MTVKCHSCLCPNRLFNKVVIVIIILFDIHNIVLSCVNIVHTIIWIKSLLYNILTINDSHHDNFYFCSINGRRSPDPKSTALDTSLISIKINFKWNTLVKKKKKQFLIYIYISIGFHLKYISRTACWKLALQNVPYLKLRIFWRRNVRNLNVFHFKYSVHFCITCSLNFKSMFHKTKNIIIIV